MLFAARVTDPIACPVCAAGVISAVSQVQTLIGSLPAARATDICMCIPPGGPIGKGSTTVLIGMLPAARITDVAGHGGAIAQGWPTVLIGG